MGLSKNSWILIVVNAIHSAIELFINTFLFSYFLNLTDNDIIPTAVFYIFTYTILTIGFPAIGRLIKSGAKLNIYRLSFVIGALLLILIIYLKNDVIRYIWLLGLILGFEKVMFYFPQNLLTSEIAKTGQLIKFNGYQMAIVGATKIIMPIVFGWLITIDSFINTSIFVLILTAFELILSGMLKSTAKSSKNFNIKALMVLALRRKKVKTSLIIDILKGFAFDIADTLIVLYIIYMFKTDLNLGIFTSIFAICNVVVNAVFGKYCRSKTFSVILAVSTTLTFIGTIYFVFNTTQLAFIIYNLIFASAAQLIRTITTINMYKVSQERTVSILYRTEYMALREIGIGIGRIAGYGLVILAALSQNQQMLKYLILFISIIFAIMGYMSVVLSNWINTKENAKC